MTSPERDPEPREGIEDLHLYTAWELLDALRPSNLRWKDEPMSWIHRGHANAEWALRASAVRKPGALAEFGATEAGEWSGRAKAVTGLLMRFRDGLDAAGVPIPTRPPLVDAIEQNEITTGAEPMRQAFPLMAFAQHHGLPTLLLDWTRRGLVAAYMAASAALDPSTEDPGTHLAVWSLRAHAGERFAHGSNSDQTFSMLEVYQAPGGTNPNLRAQAGLFTLLFGYDDPSVEAFVRRAAPRAPRLARLTLPHAEAPAVLKLLAYEGITGASMFPGADGVVRSLREEAIWSLKGGDK